MKVALKFILTIILSVNASILIADPKNSPIVHIKPGQSFSVKFDENQTKIINSWLENNLASSVILSKEESWVGQNRPGKYSNKTFFKTNAGYLNLRYLGNIKHIKSGRDISLLLVQPDDNQKMDITIRPTESFIVLISPAGVVEGPALPMKKDWFYILNSQLQATCISGKCDGGKDTARLPDGTLVKGVMDKNIPNSDFELIYPNQHNGASIFVGKIDYKGIYPTKGKLYYEKEDAWLHTIFQQGVPTGEAKLVYKGGITVEGKANSLKGLDGDVITKLGSEALSLKGVHVIGRFKDGAAIGKHELKLCSTCKTEQTVDFDQLNNASGKNLYGPDSSLSKIVENAKNLEKFKSKFIDELKKNKIPIAKEWNLACGKNCELNNNIPNLQGDDVRVFILTSMNKGKYEVSIGNLGTEQCNISNNICIVQFKKKGLITGSSFKIKRLESDTTFPSIVTTIIAGHKKRDVQLKPKTNDWTSKYMSQSDVKNIIAKIMSSKKYSIVWSYKNRLSMKDGEAKISLTNAPTGGRALKGGLYRLFIWDPNSNQICMQWESNYRKKLNDSSGRFGSYSSSTKKACDKTIKHDNGSLSNISFVAHDDPYFNYVKISGPRSDVTLVLVREY